MLTALALTATGCGQTTAAQSAEPVVLSFVDDDGYQDLVADKARHRRNSSDGFLTTANPADTCASTAWTEAAAAALSELGHDPTSVTSEQTGQGCRTASTRGSENVEVRLELLSSSAMNEVVAARVDPPEGLPPALMGFEELGFDVTDGRITSSLLHPGLDRLEEHRWIDLGDGRAVFVSLTVEPGGTEYRDTLLAAITGLESAAKAAAVDQAAITSVEDEAVLAALRNVINSIVEARPLDDATTPAGLDAISFEYAFPENMAGIATHRDNVVCDENGERSECRIDTPDSTYHFAFAPGPDQDQWLLDDFHIER